jgi:tetratricopeptide (TPR) repeat protein
MAVDLEEIRLQMFDHPREAVRACARAFAKYGIDPFTLGPTVAAEKLHGSAIRDQLLAALDDWALADGDTTHREKLLAVTRPTDPDHWRDSLRRAIIEKDVATIQTLAESDDLAGQPVSSLVLLGKALLKLSQSSGEAGALAVLRKAHRRYPGDVWVNHLLAGTLDDQKPSRLPEAIRYYTAMVALRPRSASARMNLAYALERTGAIPEAIEVYGESLRLNPNFALAHMNLGNALQRNGQIDRAIDHFRESIRLDETDPYAHYNLGNAYIRTDRVDAAVAAYRRALRLDDRFAEAWANLGAALNEIGERDEEIEAYRRALEIDKTDVFAINNLGRALQACGRLEDAVVKFNEALAIKPDYATARCNLGLALQSQGKFVEALASLKRGHEIGAKDPRWRRPSVAWIGHCERLIALDSQLSDVIAGKVIPKDDDRDEWVELCLVRQLPATAAQYLAAAFTSQPTLAQDLKSGRRYNAACAAAIASRGMGREDPPLGDAVRANWRRQAVDWLRADLSLWAATLTANPAQARAKVRATLRHWQLDPDLAGIRDPSILSTLSTPERDSCRKLWDEVEALLSKARAGTGSNDER